jgi:hypothetical protein
MPHMKYFLLFSFCCLICLTPARAIEVDHSKGWAGLTGSDLLPMCQAVVDVGDGKRISESQAEDGRHCMGYLGGFLDGFTMGQFLSGATQVLCFPEGVNTAQMIRVVEKWLHDHPTRLHEPAFGLVFAAVRVGFACQPAVGRQGTSQPDAQSPGGAKPQTESVSGEPKAVPEPPVSVESLGAMQDAQMSADNDKALATAKEVVRQKPTDGFAWYTLGQAYVKLNDYKSAEEPLKRALKAFLASPPPSNPKDTSTMTMLATTSFALADVCDKLHKKREAERYRNSALMIVQTQRDVR